ncbi:hypothetical protein BDW22DRAFT_1351567 [Trametopsis cervina]|nr:hypothetical protein BDW22DRAFT_1351567 [Trametopsis cervina]
MRSPGRVDGSEQHRLDATSSKRVDERNVARDIANQERTPTSPSQVYHSPIASYTWSRYSSRTSDPNTPPLLFVEYKNYPPSATANAPPERQLSLSSVSRQRNAGPSCHPTSLSAVTSASSSPRERSIPYPRPAPLRQPSSDSTRTLNESVRERVSPPADRELQNTFRRLDIKAQNPRRRRLGGSPTWPYSSESESSSGQSPGAPGSSGPSRHGTADPEADDWTKYAKALQGGGSSAQYACTWVETGDNIFDNACGYVSKKHLVKRHIESKHLQIKPITCEVCGKGFAQRTNWATHMNTHTGAAPHKCPFEGCDATFGDPARRHRHMKTVHNHQPSKRRTQSGHSSVVLDIDISEPEEEDSS